MEPVYSVHASEAEYRNSCDIVLRRAEREILLFDRDLSKLRLDETERLELLANFLAGDGRRSLRMVLHDPDPLRQRAPRLLQLLGRHSHLCEIRQTPDNLTHLADAQILADGIHGVRRLQYDQPRSTLILDDPAAIGPWVQRFEDLWAKSHPCLSVNTTGL